MTQGFSSDLSVVSISRRSNGAGTGAASVTVHGASMGHVCYTGKAREGHTGCEATEWESDSSVRGFSAIGSRSTAQLVLTSKSVAGSISQAFSFDLSVVSSISPPNSAVMGKRAELVSGHSFGALDYTTEVSIGSSACHATQWRAGTSVRCRISPGIATKLSAILTAGSGFVTGSLSVSFTYDIQHCILMLPRSNFPRTAMQIFTVIGREYGIADYTLSPRMGYSACESSVWISDSAVSCRIAAGTPNGQAITLTLPDVPAVGPRLSTRILMWSFDFPMLHTVGSQHHSIDKSLYAANSPRYTTPLQIVVSGFDLIRIHPRDISLCVPETVPVNESENCSLATTQNCSERRLHLVCRNETQYEGVHRETWANFSQGSMFVRGSSFGIYDSTLNIRYGGTASEATQWISDSSLASRLASGSEILMHENAVCMTVSRTVATLTRAFSLDVPTIERIHPGNTPGTGGVSISVFGKNMGSWDRTMTAVIGQFTCRATSWISDSVVVVQTPGAYGHLLRVDLGSLGPGQTPWIFMGSGKVGELTVSVSYDLPVVSHIHPIFAAPFQRENVPVPMRIDGQNFGGRDPSPSVSLGGREKEGGGSTQCHEVQWLSDESIWCLAIPSGVGKQIDVSVTISNQPVTVTSVFSYFAPSFIAIDWNRSRPEHNPMLMAVEGVHFGNYDTTGRARLGYTACERTEFISDTSLRCKVASTGVGAALNNVVTIAVQYRTTFESFSYSSSLITFMSGCNNSQAMMAKDPETRITMSNLTFNATRCPIDVQNKTCNDSLTLTKNNKTQSNCTSFGLKNQASLVSTAEIRNEKECFLTIFTETIAPFEVPNITCSVINKFKTNLPTFGAVILLTGQYLGMSDYTPAARLQPRTALEGGFVVSSSAEATLWTSDSSIIAKMGTGLQTMLANSVMAITVNWQSSRYMSAENSSILLSYDLGEISHVMPVNRPATSQMAPKTIFISGGGMADYSSRVRMYGTDCEFSRWTSDTIISCKTATGMFTGGHHGDNGAVALTLFQFRGIKEGIVTLSDAFSYDKASVVSTVVDILERQIIRVRHRANGSATVNATWDSKTPGLVHFGNQRQKSVSGIVGLTYIEGSNFAYHDVTQIATVGQTSCQSTRWLRDDNVVCRATSGPHGGSNRVSMTVSNPSSIATATEAMSFDMASLSTIFVHNILLWGGIQVSVYGNGFEARDSSLSAATGKTVCEITSWISDTIIAITISRGFAGSKTIVLSSGNYVGSLTGGLSFESPAVILNSSTVTSGFKKNLPVVGRTYTRVFGVHFGSDSSASATVRIGSTTCESTHWVSESVISCTTSQGFPSGLIPESISHTMPYNAFRISQRFLGYKSFAHQGQLVVTIGRASMGTATHAFSYDVHSLGTATVNDSVWVIDQPRAGVMGQVIHNVTGFGFASFDVTPTARVGETTTELTLWQSDSFIRCKSSSGVSFKLLTAVTIALAHVDVSDSFTYDYPNMVWMKPSFSPTPASQQVFVHGRDLSFTDLTYRSRVGSSSAEVTSWLSTTTLMLRLSSGLSKDLDLTLTAALSAPISTWQIPFQYLYPAVSQLDPGNGPIEGGYTVTIMGENFGFWDSTASSRLGKMQCEATTWISDTIVLCKAPEIGGVVKVPSVISVAGQFDEDAETADPFIYDAPRVTAISRSNSPCTGHVYIMLEGDQFGTEPTRTEVIIGATRAPLQPWDKDDIRKLGWISDSRIGFQSPPGTGIVDVVRLSIIRLRIPLESGEVEEGAPAFWYDRPNIYNITPANSPTYAVNFLATVTGKNYGTSNQTMEAKFGRALFEDALWTSDTSMTSLVPHGVGQNQSVAARVDGQVGYTDSIFSYDKPSIHNIAAPNKAPINQAWLLIMGQNFYVQDTTLSSRLGSSTSEASEWVSDSAVSVLSAASSGGTRAVAISIRHSTDLLGTMTELVSYDVPQLLSPPPTQINLTTCNTTDKTLTHADCQQHLTNSFAIGALDMTIKGASFGSQFDVSIAASVTQTRCEQSEWNSLSSLYCKIPAGCLKSRGVSITSGEILSSVSNVLSYDSAGLFALLQPTNSPAFVIGRQSVGLLGTQLGQHGMSIQLRIGMTSCEFSSWRSQTSIACLLHASIGLTLRTIVTAGQHAHGSFTEVSSYDAPRMSSMKSSNGPRNGETRVHLYGSNFASTDYTLRSSLGGCVPPFCRHRAFPTAIVACLTTPWVSDTVAGCLPSFGLIEAATIVVTAMQQVTSLTESFTYDLWPRAFQSTLTNGVPYSQLNSTVIILGQNLGESHESQAGRAGGTHCEWTRWVSSSSLRCKISSGTGSKLVIALTTGESKYDAIATACGVFTYDAISVLRMYGGNSSNSSSPNRPPAGGLDVSVLGAGFGSEIYTRSFRLAGTMPESSRWLSDSSMHCKAFPGQGTSIRIALTSQGLVSSGSEMFSFDRPHVSINMTQPRNRPSAHAGMLRLLHLEEPELNIQGQNMGPRRFSSASRHGASACEFTRWISESSTLCRWTTGSSGSRLVAVTLGHTTGSSTQMLSYNSPAVWGYRNGSHTSLRFLHYFQKMIEPDSDTVIICSINTSGRVISNGTNDTFDGIDTSVHVISNGTNGTPDGNSSQQCVLEQKYIQEPVWIESMELIMCNMKMSAYQGGCKLVGNIPVESKMNVLMGGSSMEIQDQSVKARSGGTGSEMTLWMSTSSLLVRPSAGVSLQNRGSQGDLTSMAIVVTSGMQAGSSLTEALSFDLASVSSVKAQNAPSFVAVQLISNGAMLHPLAGRSFGTVDSSVLGVRSGGSACQSTSWTSDTGIRCLRSSGGSSTRSLIVTSGAVGSAGSISEIFSYNVVVGSASTSKSLNSPTVGQASFTILLSGPSDMVQSASVGFYDASLRVRLADSRSEASWWMSDSAIVSKFAAGTGFALFLVVSVGAGQVGTTSEMASYDMHSIATVGKQYFDDTGILSQSNAPKTGSVVKFISGINFGIMDKTGAKVRAGGTHAEVTAWTSDTIMSSIMSGGAASGNYGVGLIATINVRTVSWSLPFSYDLPTLSSFAYQNGPVSIETKLLIYGSGFSHNADYSARVRFRHTAAMATGWVSESSVVANAPFGIFKFHAIIVSVSRAVRCSLTIAYSYDGTWPYMVGAGNATGLSPSPIFGNGPTSGSKDNIGIVMLGHGFDTQDKSPVIRVAGTNCAASKWLSDTAVAAHLSHGSLSRNMLDVAITVDIRLSYLNTITQLFSYQSPLGSSSSNVFHRDTDAVELLGMSFGTVSSSLASRLASTACQVTTWLSESSLLCKTSSGVQATLSATITAGSQGYVPMTWPTVAAGWRRSLGSISESISYDIPASSPIKNAHGSTSSLMNFGVQSTETILIVSSNALGTSDNTLRSAVGGTSQRYSEWVSVTSIRAMLAFGSSATSRLAITVGIRAGSMSEAISYDHIETLWFLMLASEDTTCPEDYCAKEDYIINVIGKSINYDTSVGVRMGYTTCEKSTWSSGTSIVGHVAQGCAFLTRLIVSAGVQPGSTSTGFTYFRLITSMDAPNGKVTGGLSLTLSGRGFGTADYTPRIRMAESACDSSGWVSDSCVRCKVPASIQRPERLVLTLGPYCPPDNQEACEEKWVPIILETTNSPTSGNSILTIAGLGFQLEDPTPQGRIGMTPCEITMWISDTSLNCQVSSGAGLGRSLVVTVQVPGQERNTITLEDAFMYDAPVASVMIASNLPVSGGAITKLVGYNFARADYSPDIRIGPVYGAQHAQSPFSGWMEKTCNPALWTSETSITCKSVAQLGHFREMRLEIAKLISTKTEAMSFDNPSISSLCLANSMGSVKKQILIIGDNFGGSVVDPNLVFPEEHARLRSVQFGLTACASTQWLSDTSIACHVIGSSLCATFRIMVTAAGSMGSNSEALSFDLPAISATRGNGAIARNVHVEAKGSSFGAFDFTGSVRLMESGSEFTSWISMTSILCAASVGISTSKSYIITTGISVGSSSQALSFDVPSISAILAGTSGRNIPTSTAVNTVTMHGFHFARSSFSPKLYVGNTDCESSMWTSVTSVAGILASLQTKASQIVAVTAGSAISTSSSLLSFDVLRMVSIVRASNAITYIQHLGTRVELRGSSFGFAVLLTQSARIGFTSSGQTIWTSDTFVICRQSSGIFTHLNVRVTAGLLLNSLTLSFTYDIATISSAIGNSVVAEYGFNLLSGHHFASFDATANVRFSFTSSQATKWKSDTSVLSTAAFGVGRTNRIITTLGERRQTASEAMSYDGTVPKTVVSSNYPTIQSVVLLRYVLFTGVNGTNWTGTYLSCTNRTGTYLNGTNTTVNGTNTSMNCSSFKLPDGQWVFTTASKSSNRTEQLSAKNVGVSFYSVQARSGFSGQESTRWISDSSLVCKTPSGSGGSLKMQVTAGVQTGNTAEGLVSYHLPGMSVLLKSNREQPGGAILYLQGAFLAQHDSSTRARLGGSLCSLSTWLSDSALSCRAVMGISGSKLQTVTSGMQACTHTNTFSYDNLKISAISSRNSPGRRLLPVFVDSSRMFAERIDHTLMVRLHGTATENSVWISTDQVMCKLSMAMPSSPNLLSPVILVTSAFQIGSVTQVHTFDKPELSGLIRSNAPFASETLTVMGNNFGLSSFTHIPRTGPSACEASTWQSESSVRAKSPAGVAASHTGVQLSVVVLVSTITRVWTYDAPSTSIVRSSNVAGIHVVRELRALGIFAEASYSPGLRVDTSSERTTWCSTSAVIVRTSRGLGRSLKIAVTEGSRISSTTEFLSFDNPLPLAMVSSTVRTNDPATGAAMLTLQGINFGSRSHSSSTRVAFSAMEYTVWISDSKISARSTMGSALTAAVLVTAGRHGKTTISVVSWDLPILSSMAARNVPVYPSPNTTVSGFNFGQAAHSISVQSGGTAAGAISWLSDSAVCCKVSQGLRATLPISITCFIRVASSSSFVSFDAPRSSSIRSANVPNTGSVRALVFGYALAQNDVTKASRIGSSACEQSLWLSSSTMMCRSPSGIDKWSGKPHFVVLTAGERVASVSDLFSYLIPSVSGSALPNGPWRLGNIITIIGQAIGLTSQSQICRIGFSSVEVTRWESETSVRCAVQGGVGASWRVAITAGVFYSSFTEAYSYDVPMLSKLRDKDSKSNRPTENSLAVTLLGRGFASRESTLQGRPGITAAERSTWISLSNVDCKVPPQGQASLIIQVTAGLLAGSLTQVYTFDTAFLSQVRPWNRPGQDSSTATIQGGMFGSSHYTRKGRVSFVGSACEASDWVSVSALRCKKAGNQNPGGSIGLVLTSANKVGSTSAAWSYDHHILSKFMLVGNLPSTGVTSITIVGYNYGYGVRGVSLASRVGPSNSEYTAWISDSSLTCRTGRGLSRTKLMAVTAGGQKSSITESVTFESALIKPKGRPNLASTGAISMLVLGSGFGLDSATAFYRVGSTTAENTYWTSDTQITSQVSFISRCARAHILLSCSRFYACVFLALFICTI